ncbi:MAG: TonB family protein, partial [Rubritepida sp.]|nr:TonB family protein [Rubritepida sp.]
MATRREPLPPAWRPAAARPRWRTPQPVPPALNFPVWLIASLAVHVLIAAMLYFWPDPRPSPPDQLPPPTFDIVFQGSQPDSAAPEPPEGVETEPSPPQPPPMAEPPPPPDAPPVPSQPAVPPSQQ